MKCALLAGAAFAGSPPVFLGDGSGPIGAASPTRRLSCTQIDASTSPSYPRNGVSFTTGKTIVALGPSKRGGGEVYVATPVIPGAQVRKTQAAGGKYNYCVRPFLVNTGEGPSPSGITVYLTRNLEQSHVLAGVDTALVTSPSPRATPRSATVSQSIPAKTTEIIPQIWCTTLSESAANGLSLFVNVPRQSLLIATPKGDSTGTNANTTTPTSTQKVGVATRNFNAAIQAPRAVQEYSTVCKLEFDTADQSPADPQPRVLALNELFNVPESVVQSYLPTVISVGPSGSGKPNVQVSPK
jgi:hypothetical protein